MFTVEQLIGVLHHVIVDNDLCARHGEDTIGVLMRCGAFHVNPRHAFITELAEAIENYKPTIKLGKDR